MPRESAASLSVLPVVALARISPPPGLDAAEIDLFLAVVNSKPADWFGEDSAPLLVEYVRAIAMSDRLNEAIKGLWGPGTTQYESAALAKELLNMRDKEAKRATSLATKLRLTQQSRYTPQAAATADKKGGGVKPWDRLSAPRS